MKSIITALLVLVALTVQAQTKQVVWEKPSAFMGNYNSEFKITKVELKSEETVLHVNANYSPGNWIRFDKNSFLQTPDGKRYGITGGLKTNEGESDLLLDSLFWMPESGTANLALHFKPVPQDTKEMDFSEGDFDGAFRFFNISDAKTKKKLELPAEWQNVKYAKDETLPAAKINKGIATINVKMLGYKPGMKLEFYIGGFKPLGTTERFDKFFPFADDGTVKVEVPLWLTRQVNVGVRGLAYCEIIIAPDQETNILMKVTADHKPFVAFKGFMAKTNMDMSKAEEAFRESFNDFSVYPKVKDCNIKEERLKCLQDIFDQRVAAVKKTKFTTAAKDLICMAAEEDYVKWKRDFVFYYSQYHIDEDGTVVMSYENLEEKMEQNKDLLPLTEAERAYTWQYLNEPGSPCSDAFWNADLRAIDKNARNKNAYNADILDVAMYLNTTDKIVADAILNRLTSEDCKNIIREYQSEQKRLAEELASQGGVFFQKFDDVAPENILQTILDRYKGKVVLIDIWATWCGPCRAGHEIMKPWKAALKREQSQASLSSAEREQARPEAKQELKGKNIQFVYITSPTSPLKTWQEMIKDIDGDHYYLTKEQYQYILNKYESEGIPTYAIYDAEGNQTFKTIGFSGLDVFKNEVNKVLK